MSYAWEQQSYAAQCEYAGHLARWIDAYVGIKGTSPSAREYDADPRVVMPTSTNFLESQPFRLQHPFIGMPLGGRTSMKGYAENCYPFSDSNHRLATLLGGVNCPAEGPLSARRVPISVVEVNGSLVTFCLAPSVMPVLEGAGDAQTRARPLLFTSVPTHVAVHCVVSLGH